MIKNLRLLRQERGISQQQLADVLGISQQSVNKYENHNVEPDIGTLIRMADLFCVSVDFLVGKTEADEGCTVNVNDDEKYILESYRSFNAEEKYCVKVVVETLHGKNISKTFGK